MGRAGQGAKSVTEGPIPSERPEQHGCGHAICFQSRSQRNPPVKPKKDIDGLLAKLSETLV